MADTTTTTSACPQSDVLTTLWQTAVVGAVAFGVYYWMTGEGVIAPNLGSRAARYVSSRAKGYMTR